MTAGGDRGDLANDLRVRLLRALSEFVGEQDQQEDLDIPMVIVGVGMFVAQAIVHMHAEPSDVDLLRDVVDRTMAELAAPESVN